MTIGDVNEVLTSPLPAASNRISSRVQSPSTSTSGAEEAAGLAGTSLVEAGRTARRRSVTSTTRSGGPLPGERHAYLMEYPVTPLPQMKPSVGAALTADVSRAMGLAGVAPPRPPRAPPRPPLPPAAAAGAAPFPRPLAAAGFAGAAGSAVARPPAAAGPPCRAGATASAAISGARSASDGHRDRLIVHLSAGRVMVVAFMTRTSASPAAVSAGMCRRSGRMAITSPIATTRGSLAIIVVRPFDAPEPLHQPLELVVRDLGATFAHINRNHAPAVWRMAAVVAPLHSMARGARPGNQGLSLRVAQKGRDLRRYVGPRERLRRGAEALNQPVQQHRAIGGWHRDIQTAVLRSEVGVPGHAIERIVGIVIDTVAAGAVLEN